MLWKMATSCAVSSIFTARVGEPSVLPKPRMLKESALTILLFRRKLVIIIRPISIFQKPVLLCIIYVLNVNCSTKVYSPRSFEKVCGGVMSERPEVGESTGVIEGTGEGEGTIESD